MQLSIVSYNGVAINDGASYRAGFDGTMPHGQAETELIEVARHRAAPAYVDTAYGSREFRIRVTLLGTTFHTQIATLKRLFNAQDATLRRLIAKDTADGNKQWFLLCKCKHSYLEDLANIVFVMQASDPVWRAVNATTQAINVTASGQTAGVNPAGMLAASPILAITPTSAKTGGYNIRRFVRVYNALAAAFTAYPIEVTGGGLDTAAMVADTSKSNQINQGGGINASVMTIPIDTAVGGGLPTVGMGMVDSEQIKWTGNSGTQLTGVTRGIGGTTAASHADNAVIKRSKMLANGDDVAVVVDGVEAPRWFGTGSNAMNQAATKIWIVANWAGKLEASIEAAGAGDATVVLQNTKENRKTIGKLPSAGMALMENEVITYTGKDGLTLTGVTRGVKGTSAAAHSAGVTLRRLEHDIWLAYGDPNAVAPTVDDTQKPIFALTSSNTNWAYSGAFRTTAGKRAGEWLPALLSTSAQPAQTQSLFYTADYSTAGAPAYADPASEMGMRIASFLKTTAWAAENARLEWRLVHPAGITHINPTGETNRPSAVTWTGKITAQAQASTDGRAWNAALSITAPSAGWNAWSPGNTALAAASNFVRFTLAGPVTAGSGNEVDWEIDAVTLTLASANVPQVTLGSEGSTYDLNATITNSAVDDLTGEATIEWMTVRFQMEIGQTLKIDCDEKRVTYLKDNSSAFSAITGWSSVRQAWLDLRKGTNTIKFEDAGTVAVTVDVSWQDRQN